MTDHVDAIMTVMQAAFDPAYGEAWTRRQVHDALEMPHTHYILSQAPGPAGDEQPNGFILSRHAADEEELLLIAVLPQDRGKGYGAKLLDEFFVRARQRGANRLFLEMREGNPAENLYANKGFHRVGRRKGYYRGAVGGPVDAITFACEV